MIEPLRQAQDAIYGKGKGPPIAPAPSAKRRPSKGGDAPAGNQYSIEELKKLAQKIRDTKDEIPLGQLPGDFPPKLAFRALAAYATLRTLSIQLRLSPFTPTVFLRALYLPFPNRLMGEVHLSLLRVLLADLGSHSYKAKGGSIGVAKRRQVDNLRCPLRAGDNLTYLDCWTWPLFYDDYCHLVADRHWHQINDTMLHFDHRSPVFDPSNLETDARQTPVPFVNDRNRGAAAEQRSKPTSNDYDSDVPEVDSDSEFEEDDEVNNDNDDDEDFLLAASAFRKKRRRRSRRVPNASVQQPMPASASVPPERLRGSGEELPGGTDLPPDVGDVGHDSAPNNTDVADEIPESGPIHSSCEADECDAKTKIESEDRKEHASDWLHFEPILQMRSGKPYHALDIDLKLVILEYLIDELLSLESFSAEMTKRRLNHFYDKFVYGMAPTSSELSEIENQDECAICGIEGNLLCCDNCIRSYHHRCIGMSPAIPLPDGPWFCPECRCYDASRHGPLQGGQKESIDWWTKGDVEGFVRLSNQQTLTCPSETTTAESLTTNEDPSFSKDQFILVHGFLFLKNATAKVGSSQYHSICPDGEISRHMHILGMHQRIWPTKQLPESTRNPGRYQDGYFGGPSSYDPSFYTNIYRDAPPSKAMSPRCGSWKADLARADLESACGYFRTHGLSEILTRNLTLDAHIKKHLVSGDHVIDPFLPARGFLLKLEFLLRRAYLLDDLWETGSGEVSRSDRWQALIKRAKSVETFSALVIQLVDRVHPVAFTAGWFHNSHARSVENVSGPSGTSLSTIGSTEIESQIFLWERTPLSCALGLLTTEDMKLDGMLDGMHVDPRPRHALVPRKRRKLSREQHVCLEDKSDIHTIGQHTDSPNMQISAVLSQGAAIDASGTGKEDTGVDQSPSLPAVQDSPISTVNEVQTIHSDPQRNRQESRKLKRRDTRPRRSDRMQVLKGQFSNRSHTAVDREQLLKARRRVKFEELAELVGQPFLPEGHWPVAGRLLFEPEGELSRSEARRLGRRGGGVASPHVIYSTSHEVGQVSHAHIWRKNVKSCHCYEELLLCIRTLQSFLDPATINAADSFNRKSSSARANSSRLIATSKRDMNTGIMHFLVIHKAKKKWEWVSSRDVDVHALLLFRRELVLKHKTAFQEKMKHKIAERIRAKSAAESKMREEERRRLLESQRRRDLERKAILDAKIKAQREAELLLKSGKSSHGSPSDSAASSCVLSFQGNKLCVEPQLSVVNHQTTSTGASPLDQPGVKVLNEKLRRVLLRHEEQVGKLTKRCIEGHIFPVPEEYLQRIRNENVKLLDEVGKGLKQFGVTTIASMSREKLFAILINCEKAAVSKLASGNGGSSKPKSDPPGGHGQYLTQQRQNAQMHHAGQMPIPQPPGMYHNMYANVSGYGMQQNPPHNPHAIGGVGLHPVQTSFANPGDRQLEAVSNMVRVNQVGSQDKNRIPPQHVTSAIHSQQYQFWAESVSQQKDGQHHTGF